MSRVPDFEAWAIFSRVARLRSFSAAAAELNLSPATVSKAVSRLEESLGAALIHRSTRTLSLTPTGLELVEQASSLLGAAEALDDVARSGSAQPRGLVRISAPVSFGVLHIAPLLPGLYDALPNVTVDLQLDDALTDLVASGFDVAVRIGWPRDSTLLARRLFDLRSFLVASPAYLARHGAPATPHDISAHACLSYSLLSAAERWKLVSETGEEVRIDVPAILTTNSGDAMLPLLHAGRAMAHMPEFMILDDLATGRLVKVLPHWRMATAGLYLVTPSSGPRPARVTAVLDHLARHLPTRMGEQGEPDR
ncbi:LysR family transcriptional regulator [Methylopila musalis]|uniref:LysR family transcriptional regulator n=1 Tax=Methylopila musalis TaxID=1134781 RepID=A0ABW3Z2K7_9HYPH